VGEGAVRLDGPGNARLKLWGRCVGVGGLLASGVTGGRKRVGLEGKRRTERTDLFRLFFLITFLYWTEHPLCHGLVVDTELNGCVQDGCSEDCVRIPLSRPRTRSRSVHRRGSTKVVKSTGVSKNG